MVAALLLAASLFTGDSPPPAAHPLHTTMAEVTIDRAHRSLRVVVRVFADDLGAALAAAKTTGSWDARAAAYVASGIAVVDDRQRLVMRDCGARRQGDLLWLCAEGSLSAAPSRRLTLRDQMLCELFADQVNIARISDGAATRSMLFTRGDSGKPISD